MRSPRSAPSRLRRAAPIFAAAALCAFAAPPTPARQGDASPHAPEITAAEIEAHLRVLASDAMRGRATGSPEQVEAAHYLADVLRAAGVPPAGDEGSYLQRVPFTRTRVEGDPELLVIDAEGAATKAQPEVDFQVLEGAGSTGRLRVLRVGSQQDLPETADASIALYMDGSFRDTRDWLEAGGFGEGSGFGAIVLRGSPRPGHGSGRRTGGLEVGDAHAPHALRLRVNGSLRDRFDAASVASIELHQRAELESVSAYNVVARIAGVGTPERPELAQEVVVFTAHYDHLGTREAPDPAPEGAEPPDLVYNGADDDASGTTCVLELAERFAAEAPPARTLVFCLVTGEEIGLLGTFYYLDHPVEPLERTVCNLNFEMIGRPDEKAGGPGKLWLTGHERSNLFDAIRAKGIAIGADLRPEEHFFERSDNIAFAIRGIVAQTLSSYNMHGDYHQVSDEADALDYAHMETAIRSCYEVARLLADGAIDPEWLPGGSPARR